jgi:hypothetical protein
VLYDIYINVSEIDCMIIFDFRKVVLYTYTNIQISMRYKNIRNDVICRLFYKFDLK